MNLIAIWSGSAPIPRPTLVRRGKMLNIPVEVAAFVLFGIEQL
jgi:hypothetical protein